MLLGEDPGELLRELLGERSREPFEQIRQEMFRESARRAIPAEQKKSVRAVLGHVPSNSYADLNFYVTFAEDGALR